MQNYWMLKTEPDTYSFQDMVKDGKTNWDGVRNFQARNFLKKAKKGDLALIYHTGNEKSVVGIAKIVKEAYPDPDPKKPGDWVQIDLQAMKPIKSPVPLKEIRSKAIFENLLLLRNGRLSVIPLTKATYNALLRMGK